MHLQLTIASLVAAAFLAAWSGRARADKQTVDVSEISQSMRVFHDGQGHYLAIWLEGEKSRKGRLFWGNGRQFVEMPSTGEASLYKGALRFTIGDRRVRAAHVEINGDDASAYCERSNVDDDKVTKPLTLLAAAEARAIIKKARFFPEVKLREPHLLSRDALGIYYYVDRAPVLPYADFRLYVGEAGSMKQIAIRTVALDTVGQVFATKKGALQVKRIRRGDLEAFAWVLPNRQVRYELTSVPTRINEDVIFNVLGVYGVQRVGSHCDDL